MTMLATRKQASGESMPRYTPCIHVGFYKSASTTLQRNLFVRHPQVMNVGRPNPDPRAFQVCDAIMQSVLPKDAGGETLNIETNRQVWGQIIRDANAADRRLVLSREAMTLHCYYPPSNPRMMPKALLDVCGPARIILVVRDQLRLLESWWLHKAKVSNYTAPAKWFDANRNTHVQANRYFEIAEAYSEVFGRKNVRVFLFEDLVDDSDHFAMQLCAFIGIDSDVGASLLRGARDNVRKTQRLLTYARIREKLFPSTPLGYLLPQGMRRAWHKYLWSGDRATVDMPEDWVRYIKDYYREDNRKLAAHYGLPLEKYGYPL